MSFRACEESLESFRNEIGDSSQARNDNFLSAITRRHFIEKCSLGMGALFLAGLSKPALADYVTRDLANPAIPVSPLFAPRAKRVIYLHMAGAPSQLELFDYKPKLRELHNQLCPESLLEGKRFAFIKGRPKLLGYQGEFKRCGQAGIWVGSYFPQFRDVVDDVCVIKTMYTDQFNHAPAQLLVHTGAPRVGRPSLGSWVIYGLGTENQDLPGFIVLLSGGKNPDGGKNLWSSGFIPSVYQGVQCRSHGEPVLYVENPAGVDRAARRTELDTLAALNRRRAATFGDPETQTRIAQYELAFRMQMSVPEAMDIAKEPPEVHELYGTQPGKESFANNCLLARRLVERGVRFVQLYDWGWDSHGAGKEEALNGGFPEKCRATDQAMTALLIDLKRRGLLDDTLVVWGGEFGRTPMMENRSGKDNPFLGRDHNPGAFTIWAAGGGIRGGMSYGETDELGYEGVRDRVHVHDLQATILHLLGVDHTKLIYEFQGRPFRLTDVSGEVIKPILA